MEDLRCSIQKPGQRRGLSTSVMGGKGENSLSLGMGSWGCRNIHSVSVHMCCHSKREMLSFDGIHTSPSFSNRRKGNMPGSPGNTKKIFSHWCQSIFSICYIQVKMMVSNEISLSPVLPQCHILLGGSFFDNKFLLK